MSRLDSVNASIVCKSSVVPLPCNSCDALLVENEKLKRDFYLGDKQLTLTFVEDYLMSFILIMML